MILRISKLASTGNVIIVFENEAKQKKLRIELSLNKTQEYHALQRVLQQWLLQIELTNKVSPSLLQERIRKGRWKNSKIRS